MYVTSSLVHEGEIESLESGDNKFVLSSFLHGFRMSFVNFFPFFKLADLV
jgi:hypothetical protein